MGGFFAVLFGRRSTEHINPKVWHRCRPLWPVRLMNGGWSIGAGQVWRRLGASGRWEYRQDAETRDDWCDRQW